MPIPRDSVIPERIGSSLIAVGLLALSLAAIELSLERAYAVDEFAYAHAGWLIAQGEVPARDFFETKFLLPLWVFSTVFVVGGDAPGLIQVLRIMLWPFLALILVASGYLNRREGRVVAWLTPLVILANPVFMNSAIEIRPDIVALTFFVTGLALLDRAREGVGQPVASRAALAAGLLLGAALFATAKAAVYGAPLALFWVWDATRRAPAERAVFVQPVRSLIGVIAVLAVFGVYFLVTGSFAEFYENTIVHNQKFLVGRRWRAWQVDATFLWQNALWLHALALLGMARLGLQWGQGGRSAIRGEDGLLIGLLISTGASHGLQLYPFLYSLQPFMVIEALFAGRGIAALLELFAALRARGHAVNRGPGWDRGMRVVAVAAIACMVWGGVGVVRLYHSLTRMSNSEQHQLLSAIDRFSTPGECVYDNSGTYVSRPHAYHMPWTDAPIRHLLADELAVEVPRAILGSQCVMAVMDDRFKGLPPSLRQFVVGHFRPFQGTLWLWGRDYDAASGRVESSFLANRAGDYALYPPDLLENGQLEIDGEQVATRTLRLSRGPHSVRFEGEASGFRIQWQPVDRSIGPEPLRADASAPSTVERREGASLVLGDPGP